MTDLQGVERGAGPETTIDDFLGGRLAIEQPKHGFRSGLDAVFLAAAVAGVAGAGGRILDVGSGAGVVALACGYHCRQARVTGIEQSGDFVALAKVNASANRMEKRVHFFEGDVMAPLSRLADTEIGANQFDHVAANPPYHDVARARISPEPLKKDANAMAAGGLERWVRFMAAVARPGGTLTLIHRAEALEQVLTALERRFGSLRIFPLYPRHGAPAGRVIVQGRKASRGRLELLQGLVLHDATGAFLPAARDILMHAKALDLADPT